MPISILSPSLRLLIILGLSLIDVVRGQYGAVGMENEGDVLSPRYYMGLEEGRLLRRDSGVCESGLHSCNYSHFLIFYFIHTFHCADDLKSTFQKKIG